MMYRPESTYRIQFHKGFTFSDFEKIIPYLCKLGIKTIYASPVFAAVAGSLHGYDGTDSNRINPEIGTLEQLKHISQKLKELKMGWIQDFVPNHMAYSMQNKWVEAILEKGDASVYNTYFDHLSHQRIMAPFLGKSLEEALGGHEISIVLKNGRFRIKYFEKEFPVNETSAGAIAKRLPSYNLATSPDAPLVQTGLKEINADLPFLRSVLDNQYYRLCSWEETNHRINYRRFFMVNSLICMNIQDDKVFQDYHRLLLQLVRENIIQGIRIDHVDGLLDPSAYLKKLRESAGNETYIVVEKILEFNETFPGNWPIAGSTGYDFLTIVNKVLTNKKAAPGFNAFYEEITKKKEDITQGLYQAKRQILLENMEGELQNLLDLFLSLPGVTLISNNEVENFRKIIAALLIYCPVYRFYPDSMPLSGKNANDFLSLMSTIKENIPVSEVALSLFKACFTLREGLDNEALEKRLYFLERCMQVSGPLMAKGMEDTLMYRYFRFIAHNEVGDDLKTFGISSADFHQRMKERQQHFPYTLNATATHDTKRGEDVRARLQVLSFQPGQWMKTVRLLLKASRDYARDLTLADQYFILQNLLGTFSFKPEQQYSPRLKAYLQKAAREAKLQSSWDKPDEAYEWQLFQFALSFMDKKSRAGKNLQSFLKENEERFITNSLVQLALKCTCPGIPDIYQGTELWDLSFVDPDNRQPVDYQKRARSLEDILDSKFSLADLIRNGDNGKIKLFTLYHILRIRKKYPEVFERGRYDEIKFPGSEKYIAFSRSYKGQQVLIVLPKGGARHSPDDAPIDLAPCAPSGWKNVFTKEIFQKETITINALLQNFPIAVLESLPVSQRGAGVLLPVFSLRSEFGTGGLGKEAYKFVDFLSLSGQKYWQILPLNPVSAENAYSPYAAVSSFAAEPLYIDPEKLVTDGFLTKEEVDQECRPPGDKVNYAEVSRLKNKLLQKAWRSFSKGTFEKIKLEFKAFCTQQSWLHDYCLYKVAKQKFGNKPWTEWPPAIKNRSAAALKKLELESGKELAYQKWLQFLFSKQWQELKLYCEQLNIRLIGDLPFYVSLDSADVWAHQNLFSIDDKGAPKFMAGVPPDYFNANGQSWEMPTYNWEALERENYSWWVERMKRNIELYHLLRLDHFRAFYDYWEIPADAKTAKEGKWQPGPREKLWSIIKKELPEMPFIAEDLGDIHPGVYQFCNRLQLPGMRVLQFGFGNYNAGSRDLPHNFIPDSVAYTGTHDNNTTVGWYRSLDKDAKNKINRYAGHNVNDKNISDTLIDIAYKSVAQTVIIPLQDILGLGAESRINTPATAKGNWTWRMDKGLDEIVSKKMLDLVQLYNR